MKNIQLNKKSLIIAVIILLSGCQDIIYESFLGNSPVYMTYEELRSSVKVEQARDILNPGKIYFKDDYLFINEFMKGVHVIDASDPANPVNTGFIKIPGNVDIAIRENVLYADSYVDLVAIDVSDLANIKETGRINNIFPYTLPEWNENYRLGEVDQDKGVVVSWELVEVRQKVEQQVYPVYYASSQGEKVFDALSSPSYSGGVGGGSGTTFGVGGSMARFGLYEDYLYIVDNSRLYTINIADIENPVEKEPKNIGWNIETMFIYNAHMFLGTTTGMIVFSLENKENPGFIDQFSHITGCDPVVVQDNIAYVTLHDGGNCGRSVNRLDIIEMNEDYTQFNLLRSYPLSNPHGLGIDDDILFICDGNAGLKVFDASDPLNITSNIISEFPDINAYDVIPVNNYLFMIGDGGFYLYDYTDLQNITLLSTLPVAASGN